MVSGINFSVKLTIICNTLDLGLLAIHLYLVAVASSYSYLSLNTDNSNSNRKTRDIIRTIALIGSIVAISN